MSLLDAYRNVEMHETSTSENCVDPLTLHILISNTRHITDKEEIIDFLSKMEDQKSNELKQHRANFQFREPITLMRELTTLRFLINSLKI